MGSTASGKSTGPDTTFTAWLTRPRLSMSVSRISWVVLIVPDGGGIGLGPVFPLGALTSCPSFFRRHARTYSRRPSLLLRMASRSLTVNVRQRCLASATTLVPSSNEMRNDSFSISGWAAKTLYTLPSSPKTSSPVTRSPFRMNPFGVGITSLTSIASLPGSLPPYAAGNTPLANCAIELRKSLKKPTAYSGRRPGSVWWKPAPSG